MITYSINDLSKTSDRYNLYILPCIPATLQECISFLQSQNIPVVNIGKEISTFINGLEDYSYLNMDVFDFTIKLLEVTKAQINGSGNDVVAIYNLGILLEPALELKTSQMIKEFSKSTSLIIIWENQMDLTEELCWPTQKNDYFFDFTDTHLKTLQNAI